MPIRVKRHAVVQPQDSTIRLIPLTQNQNAIVDASDYEWLMQWNWYAVWDKDIQSFYAVRNVAKKQTLAMHRLVLGLLPGDKRYGDHRNHDTLDNRRRNLRIATPTQNQMNKRRLTKNVSGFRGVFPNGSGWMSQVRANGKVFHLGTYRTPEAAYAIYCEAAKKLHGEFAKLD